MFVPDALKLPCPLNLRRHKLICTRKNGQKQSLGGQGEEHQSEPLFLIGEFPIQALTSVSKLYGPGRKSVSSRIKS